MSARIYGIRDCWTNEVRWFGDTKTERAKALLALRREAVTAMRANHIDAGDATRVARAMLQDIEGTVEEIES